MERPAPEPILTVTIERGAGESAEIHLHAGGQGFWIARMASRLGAEATLCAALGGESGDILRALIESAGLGLRSVDSQASNGAYVHDRRSGKREVLAESPDPELTRHELDELYGATVATGLEGGVTVLT